MGKLLEAYNTYKDNTTLEERQDNFMHHFIQHVKEEREKYHHDPASKVLKIAGTDITIPVLN